MQSAQPKPFSIIIRAPPHRRQPPLRYPTEADRAAYRRDVLGLPSSLDTWLTTCLDESAGRPVLDNRAYYGAPLSGNPFIADSVKCRVWVYKSEVRTLSLLT